MEELNIKRIKELADRCYHTSQYTFTDFLTLAEQSDYFSHQRELSFVKAVFFGGNELSERRVLRFGSEDQLGYDQPFPIVCLLVSPVMEKFSDDLTHRDFLGAIMNLGIERKLIGDIFLDGNKAYVFCLKTIAGYVCESLTRIKHTTVRCVQLAALPEELIQASKTELSVQAASLRIDAVIAKVYNLSRSETAELFKKELVFADGRLVVNCSCDVKPGQAITVRGFGKFTIKEELGLSKKGKTKLLVTKY